MVRWASSHGSYALKSCAWWKMPPGIISSHKWRTNAVWSRHGTSICDMTGEFVCSQSRWNYSGIFNPAHVFFRPFFPKRKDRKHWLIGRANSIHQYQGEEIARQNGFVGLASPACCRDRNDGTSNIMFWKRGNKRFPATELELRCTSTLPQSDGISVRRLLDQPTPGKEYANQIQHRAPP